MLARWKKRERGEREAEGRDGGDSAIDVTGARPSPLGLRWLSCDVGTHSCISSFACQREEYSAAGVRPRLSVSPVARARLPTQVHVLVHSARYYCNMTAAEGRLAYMADRWTQTKQNRNSRVTFVECFSPLRWRSGTDEKEEQYSNRVQVQTPSTCLRHPSFNHCRYSYAIGSRKLSANEQFFVGAQTVVSLLQTTQIKQGVLFIATNKVYTSTNKTQSFESRRNF